MSNILVTGGAGYIGSHICKELSNNGYSPVVYDNLINGHINFVKWGPLVKGDINDTKLLKDTLNDFSIKSVIHCAALAYVRESFEKPLEYFTNNVSGTISLLGAMKESSARSIVISSSCSVYGIPKVLPVTEKSLVEPISIYGSTKAIMENIVKECVKVDGFRSISLRYFNAAGADPDNEIGELHDPEPHVIPNILKAALYPTIPFSIFGRDFDTPDGSAIRDYIHVKDLANAHIMALAYLEYYNGYKPINLGSGKGVSIFELVKKVEDLVERKLDIKFEKRHIGDPPVLYSDIKLAEEVLGWRPTRSEIDNILKDSMAYQKIISRDKI